MFNTDLQICHYMFSEVTDIDVILSVH